MSEYLNSKDIKYVMAVAEYNSVSKAADAVYVTQPALSSYITKLEDRLSIKLFERIGKKFIPTYAGEQIVKYGQRILSLERELEYKLNEIANGLSDRLRIGCVAPGGIVLLPPAIKKFKESYPDIKITIFESDPQTLKKKLINGELDLVFASSSLIDDSVDYTILAKNSLVIYAAKDSVIAKSAYTDDRYDLPVVDIHNCQDQQLFINDSLPLLTQTIEDAFKKLDYVHNPENIMHVQNQLINIHLSSLDLGFCVSYQNAHLGLDFIQEPEAFLIKGLEDQYMESVVFVRKGGFESKLINDFIQCA